MRPHPLDRIPYPPQIDNQLRYLVTAASCSLVPVVAIALLPDPLHSSLLPIAALLGAHGFMYVLALLLCGIERAWQLVRPARSQVIRCPVCYTVDQPYRRFFVARITPQLVRVHCPECHERWVTRG